MQLCSFANITEFLGLSFLILKMKAFHWQLQRSALHWLNSLLISRALQFSDITRVSLSVSKTRLMKAHSAAVGWGESLRMLPGRLVTKGHWGYLTKSSPRRATLHCPVVGPASCRTSGALPGHLEGLRHGAQRAGPATNSVHPDGILRPNSVHASSLGFGNQFFFFFFFSTDFPLYVFLIPAPLSWPTYRFPL